MRKYIQALKEYLQQEFQLATWIGVGLLLVVLFSVNFSLDFESNYIDCTDCSIVAGWGRFVLFYGLPLCVTLGILSYKHPVLSNYVKQPKFWLAVLLLVCTYSAYVKLTFYRTWIEAQVPAELAYFARKCAANGVRPVILLCTILLVWWATFRTEYPSFWGVTLKGVEWKPYLIMLACMLPLVVAASFTDGFQSAYPRYWPGQEVEYTGLPKWLFVCAFEFCYMLDFFFTEFFFRGLLVIGLGRWIGYSTVLPQAVFYAMIHFEKPIGEAISSIFGGVVLGVIALRTGSIWGGVLVHVGIALFMEWAAAIQHALHP